MSSKLQLPALAIFDMDGLIFDTERLFMTTKDGVMKEYGYTQQKDDYIHTIGTCGQQLLDILHRLYGDDYPAELVKAKFLKLDSHHIEFVMDCLRDNTTKVRNIKQYLRAMLFNAPSTINSYYASLVAHDMAQPDWGRPPNT